MTTSHSFATVAAALSLLAVASHVAAADTSLAPVVPVAPVALGAEPPAPVAHVHARKDRGTALALSLGGTLASGALVLGGLAGSSGGVVAAGFISTTFTPSLGEWYSGQAVTWGMGMRAVGIVGMGLALGTVLSDVDPNNDPAQHRNGDLFAAELTVGVGLYLAGTIYDIVDAPAAADRFNRKHDLVLAPTVMPTATGTVTGVGFSGRF